MFHSNCVGLANATTAGWGNLGGGVAHVIIVPMYLAFHGSGFSNEESWRYTLALPPVLLIVIGVSLFFFSDDCPLGDIKNLHEHNAAKRREEDAALLEVRSPSLT